MSSACAVLLAALVSVPLWPMYQYGPEHNAVFAGNGAYSWHRTLGGKINGGLAFAGSRLYVESFDKRVTALDAKTGRIIWSTRMPNVVMTTPVVADGVVIAGTGTNAALPTATLAWGRPQGDYVIALNAQSGRTLWKFRTVGEDMPSPAFVRVGGIDAIVFANGDNHLRALSVRDGRLLWTRTLHGIATMSSAAVDRGRAFVVVGTGAFSGARDRTLAIDPDNGRIVWSAPYGNADCSPTVAGGLVYVEGSATDSRRAATANAFNVVAAIEESTGKLRWRWYSGLGSFDTIGSNEEGIAGMSFGGNYYQAIPATREFAAFDSHGKVRWKIHTAGSVKMSAVAQNGRLYFGDAAHTFYTVDEKSGHVLARRSFNSFFSVSSPVIAGKTLYVANNATVWALPL
ncbi:MAG TPA: PQQ-binding-like beta-propeller repeat protein [Candidatus Rubrimentiphilum sp.]|nr:PQQ-binding-like beta-propeller repeat protein [Candidatus Rubrimentiphilum sp.]